MSKQYYIYILTNKHNTVLYTGITNDLSRRVSEHKAGEGSTFARKYNLNKLVYYEFTGDVSVAIAREKQIKAGSRQDKIDLIDGMNPNWIDLSTGILIPSSPITASQDPMSLLGSFTAVAVSSGSESSLRSCVIANGFL